ncbi:hypothetical protein CAEBREN_01470 [Caenorhabditis brenneri]|uniref:C-type lectin domain-containing protein n=1 Tax=Caenorhabditis brenneri TaxID=135651 RepID=G0N328_CAEBE|nr:hypothetical protein CAEBREN_01470 [Caenorhabditis brenneri]
MTSTTIPTSKTVSTAVYQSTHGSTRLVSTKLSTSTTSTPALNFTTPSPTTTISTVICTEGFTLINNKCWMLVNTKDYRGNANKVCFSNKGSTLVTIKSYDENEALAIFVKVKNISKIWLGLKCEGQGGSTCKWDYGQGPLGAYSNFGSGSPNVTVGDCIYYAVSTKQWISHSCSDKNVNIVCELPTNKDDEKNRQTDGQILYL